MTAITRRRFLAVTGGVSVAVLTGCSPSDSGSGGNGERKVVHINDSGGSYAAAAKKAWYDPFEAETGIKVIPVPEPATGAAGYKEEITSGSLRYDVFGPSGGDLSLFDGLLEPIDYSSWTDEDLAAFKPAPTAKYAVPSGYFALAIAYDKRVFESTQPQTWSDFWDRDGFAGKRTSPPGSWGTYGPFPEAALMADGVALDDVYPCDIDRAYTKLESLKPNILKWAASAAEPGQLLVDGRVTMAVTFSNRTQDLIDQGADFLGLVWNQAIVGWSANVVPKGAPNRDSAMKLIAFMARPEQQVAFSELTAYAPANSKAYEKLPTDRAAVLATSPDHKDEILLQDYSWWTGKDSAGDVNRDAFVSQWEEFQTS